MKLSFKDLDELRNRQQMINQHLLIAEALKDALQKWFQFKFKEYGLEEKKEYNINFKNGKITPK
jgi:hypothetical protein